MRRQRREGGHAPPAQPNARDQSGLRELGRRRDWRAHCGQLLCTGRDERPCVDVELVVDGGRRIGLGGEGQVEHARRLVREHEADRDQGERAERDATYDIPEELGHGAGGPFGTCSPGHRPIANPTGVGFVEIEVLPGGMQRNGLPGELKTGWNFPFTTFTNAKQPLPTEWAVVQLTGGMNPLAL